MDTFKQLRILEKSFRNLNVKNVRPASVGRGVCFNGITPGEEMDDAKLHARYEMNELQKLDHDQLQ